MMFAIPFNRQSARSVTSITGKTLPNTDALSCRKNYPGFPTKRNVAPSTGFRRKKLERDTLNLSWYFNVILSSGNTCCCIVKLINPTGQKVLARYRVVGRRCSFSRPLANDDTNTRTYVDLNYHPV